MTAGHALGAGDGRQARERGADRAETYLRVLAETELRRARLPAARAMGTGQRASTGSGGSGGHEPRRGPRRRTGRGRGDRRGDGGFGSDRARVGSGRAVQGRAVVATQAPGGAVEHASAAGTGPAGRPGADSARGEVRRDR